MPRPTKHRRICRLPEYDNFEPVAGCKCSNDKIVMALDEYETIRLIDLEGMTQAQCAEQMEVARTTIQAIYDQARKKLADAIVNGKSLSIAGGHYKLAHQMHQQCYKKYNRCGKGCKSALTFNQKNNRVSKINEKEF